MEVKKEIEKSEFKSIQSLLNKKESLCRALVDLLKVKDHKKVLEILFEIKKKWNKLPFLKSSYLLEINQRFNELVKQCEEKTSEVYSDFQQEQVNKLNKKKELLSQLQKITQQLQKNTITPMISKTVEKILEQWKSIRIFSFINEKELNFFFKKEINLFYKQKKSQQIEKNKEREKTLKLKEEFLISLEVELKNKGNWDEKYNFLKAQRKKWLQFPPSYPLKEIRILEKKFDEIIEGELVEHVAPLSKRIEVITQKIKKLKALKKKKYPQEGSIDQDDRLFSVVSKKLNTSFLPQDLFFNFRKEIVKIQKEFIAEHQDQLVQLIKRQKKDLITKRKILEQAKTILKKAHFSKEENNQIKKLFKHWKTLQYIPPKIDHEIETSFKKLIDEFYKKLKQHINHKNRNMEKNFLIKKNILDQLEYFINQEDKNFSLENFNPQNLKTIWEYNRQFGGKKNNQREKKSEILNLLTQWNEIKLELSFSQRNELKQRFNKIRSNLKKYNYIK